VKFSLDSSADDSAGSTKRRVLLTFSGDINDKHSEETLQQRRADTRAVQKTLTIRRDLAQKIGEGGLTVTDSTFYIGTG
jgi:hypothetical protein